MKEELEEIKKTFKKIPTDRYQKNVDRRYYLIGLLYYGYGMTEHAIAELLKIDRNRVHHNKIMGLKFREDRSYITNTADLRIEHPFTIKHVILKKNISLNRTLSLHKIFGKHNGYTINLEDELAANLEKYSRVCGTRNAASTIKAVLTKFFEEWEE